MELQANYKVLRVIGAGNIGTTLLVEDHQSPPGTAVLKVYHLRSEQAKGLKEFQMLHYSQNCPSTVKVKNIMYNPGGSFVVVSL